MSISPIDRDDPRGLRAEVRRQISSGRQTVPIKVGKKGPTGQQWHRQKYAIDDHDPHGNVGLILGPSSGNLINIDGDCKEAIELLPLLLPATGMVSGRPARGRSHWWYRGDESLSTERLQDPDKHTIVEFRCGTGSKGFQTVIPPSIHPSHEQYQWYSDGEPSEVSARDLSIKVRHVGAAALLVRAFPKANRHDFALALAGALCEAGWRQQDAQHFIFAICSVGGSGDNAEPAARNVVDSTWRKAEAKEPITGFSALSRVIEGRALRLIIRWLGLRGVDQTPDNAYSSDELQALAEREGIDVAELGKRWVIQRANSYYLLTLDGYRGPYIAQELGLVLRQYLARAPIRRTTVTQNGGIKRMTPSEIVEHCGSSADTLIADLTIPRSRYDFSNKVLYEAVRPLRELEPKHDERVERWLQLLGGPRLDKLLDWLATCWDLARQTCALYLSGKKGVGKSMLVQGLARLWTTGGPPALEDVIGERFNSSFTRCPLIFGDEIVRAPDSATLRSFIGSDVRTLRRKFVADADLIGAPRLVLAGNRKDLLRFEKEDFSEDDRDAIASRFLHIRCDDSAREYLESLGGREGTHDWVSGDVIARHVLWLAFSRRITPGKRFLVEGDADEMSDHLAVQGEVRGLVAEALCKALDELSRGKQPPAGGLYVCDGGVFVNGCWLHDNWNLYVGEAHRVPSVRRIGGVLRGMSSGDLKRIETGISRPRCYLLKLPLLLRYAEEVGIGDPDAIATFVNDRTKEVWE